MSADELKPTPARIEALRHAMARLGWRNYTGGNRQLAIRLTDAGLIRFAAIGGFEITEAGRAWLEKHGGAAAEEAIRTGGRRLVEATHAVHEALKREPGTVEHALASAPQAPIEYLGALALLARCSLGLRSTPEESADELRACIEEALEDGQKFFPKLRWKRVLNRIEVELEEVKRG